MWIMQQYTNTQQASTRHYTLQTPERRMPLHLQRVKVALSGYACEHVCRETVTQESGHKTPSTTSTSCYSQREQQTFG